MAHSPKEIRVGVDPGERRFTASDILPETVIVEILEDPQGSAFADMVEMLGGYDGVVIDPVGQRHSVSLRKWLGVDHSKVRFGLSVKYQLREDKRQS